MIWLCTFLLKFKLQLSEKWCNYQMSLTVYFDRIVFNADEIFSKDKKKNFNCTWIMHISDGKTYIFAWSM